MYRDEKGLKRVSDAMSSEKRYQEAMERERKRKKKKKLNIDKAPSDNRTFRKKVMDRHKMLHDI